MTIENAVQSGSRLKISESTRMNVAVEGSLALRRFEAPREWTSNDVDVLAFAKSVLHSESEAILAQESRLDARFCEAVSLIVECRGCVVTTGMGKAGLIARKTSSTLSSTGSPSHFVHPGEAFHGDLGAIRLCDVVLAYSNSGETEEVKRLLGPISKTGAPIIAIVSTASSSLGRAATVALEFGKIAEADSLGLAPSSSAAAMLAIGDALALAASRERGFRAEDFAQFHPGGTLGRRLSRVREVMRPLSSCRVAAETATVREVFAACRKPGRRTGAVLLVDGFGRLSGVFTDSDLARLFETRHEDAFDRPISEVMTRNPSTTCVDAMTSEAIAILSERKISELPALDEDGKPVGMLDVTDLVGFVPEEEAKR